MSADELDQAVEVEQLPPGWARPAGSKWLVGTFCFRERGDSGPAGAEIGAGLRALPINGVAVRWAYCSLLVRFHDLPDNPHSLRVQAFELVARAVGQRGGVAVSRPDPGFAGPEIRPRDQVAAQAALHQMAAELLRLEASLEDLAAEATVAAGCRPPDDEERAFWVFLEAFLAQMLLDDLGPLLDDLRTAAVWQRSEELRAGILAA